MEKDSAQKGKAKAKEKLKAKAKQKPKPKAKKTSTLKKPPIAWGKYIKTKRLGFSTKTKPRGHVSSIKWSLSNKANVMAKIKRIRKAVTSREANWRAVINNLCSTLACPVLCDPKVRKVTNEKFAKGNSTWNDPLKCRFQMPVKSKAEHEEAIERGLHSAAEENLSTENDTFTTKITNIKRLPRYHMEDILRLLDGSTMIVYFKQSNTSVMHTEYDGKPNIAAELQRGKQM